MSISADSARVLSSEQSPVLETAFEGLSDAVLVVDARALHLPQALANAAACRCLVGSDAGSLVGGTLYSFLGAADDVTGAAGGLFVDAPAAVNRVLRWHLPRGETAIATETNLLSGAFGQSVVMLIFAATATGTSLFPAIENLPLDLLILDARLSVTYANAGAVRAAGGLPGGISGSSAHGSFAFVRKTARTAGSSPTRRLLSITRSSRAS